MTIIRCLEIGGGVENFYAVVRQLKTYQCVRESSRNAVCVQAWAETMRVILRNLGVTATHQGRSHTPLTVHVNMTKASGDASATRAVTKTPVHCAVRASAVKKIHSCSHGDFEPTRWVLHRNPCPPIDCMRKAHVLSMRDEPRGRVMRAMV